MTRVTSPAVTGAAAARRGENAAARLYVEYRERIYRFAYARLRSREEAEDAVQNVFMRVHMALDRGVVPEYEAAWLFKIAHNVCLSRIDSNSRRAGEELHAFDDEDIQIAAPEVDGQELAGLSEALEAMPHNLRTAILLREWQGLSYAEIADAMGLSVSAVETLIFRARRQLAWALEHPGEKPKTPARRLLDLLGLGWLRSVFFGAGPAAKLAAGAALLALTGGGAAVALTTDAHSRPSSPPPAPNLVSGAGFAPASPIQAPASPKSANVPGAAGGARHRVVVSSQSASLAPIATPTGAAPAPAAGSATAGQPSATPGSSTQPSSPAQPVPVPKVNTSPSVPTVSAPTVSTPTTQAPGVNVPTVSVPSASEPTVNVPTVSAPAVSVPTVSAPTVSLPVG